MRISRAVLAVTVLIAPICFTAAQAPSNGSPAGSGTPAANPVFTPVAPTAILQRSLDEVQQTVGAVKLDKWKRGTVREEAGTNIDAIERDMQGTLPSLLKEADAAPGALSKVLPLSRNVDALYDVLLHVVEASRVAAPSDQVGQLQQAMADLEKARIALDKQIQKTAEVQEKQIVDLKTTVQKQEVSLRSAATPPPAPKCPAPTTPAKKKKRSTTSSTTKNPAAGTSANPPATTSKPQ